jgi:aminoglycoside phosphotransferase (APT) family kinase protein
MEATPASEEVKIVLSALLEDRNVVSCLGGWLAACSVPFEPPIVSVEAASVGRSNVTLVLTDARGGRLVVRHPPLGRVLPTAHDVRREGRIMKALSGTGVPVPAVWGICDNPGLIGAPFFVMDYVEGAVLDTVADAGAISLRDRQRIGTALPACLAQLHRQDPVALGLADLGRPGGYVERQLRRWLGQWRWPEDRPESADFHACHKQLTRLCPSDAVPPRLVHGDFRVGNVIVRDGEVAAVLDWELTALGHPLADLAYLINTWVTPDELLTGPISSAIAAGGFGDRDCVVSVYERELGTAIPTGLLNYFRAFSYWRLASIRSGVVYRLQDSADPVSRERADEFSRSVPKLIDAALSLAT